MLTVLILFLFLFFAAGAAALVFLLIRGLRTETAPVADHLAFVDDRDHSEAELMEIYGIERDGDRFAYGTMALFDTLDAAISYARTVPPHSRPGRKGGRP